MRKHLLLVALLLLGGSVADAAPTAAPAPSFARARSYEAGEATSVAIGDLNGDGVSDLSAANAEANTVSVLPGRGDGSFQVKRNYRTGRFPISVAIGDLNGDGKTDLVTANWANTVSVLLNMGDGSFAAKRDYATGEQPWVVAIGDLNGDGNPDLATANSDANTVSLLLNRGDGSFQQRIDYPTGVVPQSVAIGDLNGDGKPDIATANSEASSVSVLLNRGGGSFNPKHDYKAPYDPRSINIGDLNGDGLLDVVITSVVIAHADTVTVSVLLNKAGTLRTRHDYRAGSYPNSPEVDARAVALGDLNGDGKPDLAIGIPYEGLAWVLTSRGDGGFRPKLDYLTGRSFSGAAAIGDLTGDGKLDLAANVSVLVNTPGLCTVQGVRGKTLQVAKRTLARANCRVGKVRRVHSTVKRGRVISQRPRFGAVLPGGRKVDLVLSRGRRS